MSDLDTIFDDIYDKVFPIRKRLPQAHQYIRCRILGNKYKFNGSDWICENGNSEINDQNDFFYRDPSDEHNPSRPLIDPSLPPPPLPAPEPTPKPRPKPVTPPTTYERDPFGDRRVVPVPPQFDAPKIPPFVPVRRLPSISGQEDVNSLEIAEKRLLKVEDDALSRTYGCMLHSPITSVPAIYRQCKTDQSIDQNTAIEDAKKFFEYLIRRTAGILSEEAITSGCVGAALLLPTNMLRLAPGGKFILMFGCSFLADIAADFLFSSNNAYQDIDGQGHINVEYLDCQPPSDDTGDPGNGLQLRSPDFNINECFVPIRNFRVAEPPQLGMRKQLQIIYKLTENGTTYAKEITLPNPKDDITADDIKAVFPETFAFGTVKSEVKISPWGYIRVYTETNKQADDFFDAVIPALIEGEEIPDSRAHIYRKRKYKTGNFERYQAFLFDWSKQKGSAPLQSIFILD